MSDAKDPGSGTVRFQTLTDLANNPEVAEDQKRERRDQMRSVAGVTFDESAGDQLSDSRNEDVEEDKPQGIENPDVTPALEAFLQ